MATEREQLETFLLSVLPEPPDFTVEDHFSIFLLTPHTQAAKDWMAEFLPEDAQTWGNSVVVEHRFISDVVFGARRDGLRVELAL